MRSWRRTILKSAIYVLLVPIVQALMWVLHIPEMLGEHALVAWIDDRIAEKFGIRNPTVDQVVRFAVTWGPAALFAVLLLTAGWIVVRDAVGKQRNQLSPEDTENAAATPASSAEPALPHNANFRYRGKIFWAVPRRYTKDEAAEMRKGLREVYDCINGKSAVLVADYDGPAVMFTREWVSIIIQEGSTSAAAKLDDIRSKIREAHTELQEIVSRRPYYRQDIMVIVDDRGDAGKMNSALNDYIEALQSLPDNPTVNLLKLAVGPVEDRFTKAVDGYTKRIGAFNTKMQLAKDELEFLMDMPEDMVSQTPQISDFQRNVSSITQKSEAEAHAERPNRDAAMAAKLSEVVILKPTFMGVGIDLQRAWSWVADKWRGAPRR